MATKITRGLSCVSCQQRKLRCDESKPCHNCTKAGAECHVAPLRRPRRRKRVLDERSLLQRLDEYETLLSQHGVAFRPVRADFGPSTVCSSRDEPTSNSQSRNNDGVATHSSRDRDILEAIATADRRDNECFHYDKQFRDAFRLAQTDSTSAEKGPATLYSAFDTVFDTLEGFPFTVGASSSATVKSSRPSGIQACQLWDLYLSNVDPLLKVTHAPTLQKQIIEAGAHPERITVDLDALLFSVYLIAITSLTDEQTVSTFGEARSDLLSRYHGAAQQALINARFMQTSTLATLQAYYLYLLSIRAFVDPRKLSSLIGIAVRIAQRLGLHRDGLHSGLSPFQVEQRRRLWWNIVMLDKRIAIIAGSTVTAFSTPQADCKRPLNVNDSNLHPSSKELPASSGSATEMAFVLSRIELTTVNMPEPIRPLPTGNRPVVQPSHRAFRSPTDMDKYCDHVEETYLKDCDENIPLQYFTLMTTRQALCKLQLLSDIGRVVSKTETMSPAEREWLFIEAVMMIEYDNIVHASESCAGFLWYNYMAFPFPAYMILAPELRRTCSGPLTERAWTAISENHVLRGVMRTLESPMHIAFGGALVQAWDARELVHRERGQNLQQPEFIVLLRQIVERNNTSGATLSSDGGVSAESTFTGSSGFSGIDDWAGLEGVMPSFMQSTEETDWLQVPQLASMFY